MKILGSLIFCLAVGVAGAQIVDTKGPIRSFGSDGTLWVVLKVLEHEKVDPRITKELNNSKYVGRRDYSKIADKIIAKLDANKPAYIRFSMTVDTLGICEVWINGQRFVRDGYAGRKK